MIYYKLMKSIPGLKKGAVFYHDTADHIRGSIAYGCLKLAWAPKGDCQQAWCGGTFVFPGQLVNDVLSFKKLLNNEAKKFALHNKKSNTKIIEGSFKGTVVKVVLQEN